MATMSREQISDALSRVANQPGFRDSLTADPVTTLNGIGIACDTTDVPNPVCLPSDADISNRLDELADQVVLGLSHINVLLKLGE